MEFLRPANMAGKARLDDMYPMEYNRNVIEIRETAGYAKWFRGLRDGRAKAKINARIRRLSLGNPGDVKSVGSGVIEMRIDYGPGYRLYFAQRGEEIVILLAGGDKKKQTKDIAYAIELARRV
jgi:putative addiction module killer protein